MKGPMRIEFTKISILIFLLATMSCSDDKLDIDAALDNELYDKIASVSPNGEANYYSLPNTNQYDLIPQDVKNPMTSAKVKLGKFLFFETGIALDAQKPSGMGTYSCSSCHVPEAGFRPGRMQGIADGGMGFGEIGDHRIMNDDYTESDLDVQSARPLSLVNVAYVKNTFWNGQFGGGGANEGTEHLWSLRDDTKRNHLGYEALETQNIEGINAHRLLVNKEITDEFGYTNLFDESFSEYGEQFRYSNFTASLAMSAYLRSIISYDAPFQHWLKGNDDAMTNDEKKGALLFFGKAKCASCHYNQNLGSNEFHALGVNDMDQHIDALDKNPNDRRNYGRGGFTMKEEDMYKFKVPGIYNMKDTPFYFHGSSKTSLKDVIEYKLNAEPENIRVSKNKMSYKLVKTTLTDTEKDQLISFLENALRDPSLERYKPDFVGSGLCYPNNDVVSQIDLGCN